MQEAGNAILLDANLLVLLVVGQFDGSLVGRKRLDAYLPKVFDLLVKTIAPFRRNLTTPHLLAEVSNLTDQCVPKNRHREFREFFRNDIIGELDERWASANQLCQTAEFMQLGLADAAVCHLADERCLVLSVDLELCNALWGRGVNTENFNDLRDR
jgi:hypothetical protein